MSCFLLDIEKLDFRKLIKLRGELNANAGSLSVNAGDDTFPLQTDGLVLSGLIRREKEGDNDPLPRAERLPLVGLNEGAALADVLGHPFDRSIQAGFGELHEEVMVNSLMGSTVLGLHR